MRLLYIVPYAPTPIRTRPFHLLEHLFRQGHVITLATLAGDAPEAASLAEWRAKGIQVLSASLPRLRSGWNIARALLTTAPLQAAFCWQPSLMSQIRKAIETTAFDLIQVEHLRGAWYGMNAQKELDTLGRATPVLWDSVDCITRLFEQTQRMSARRMSRWLTRFELGRTRPFESMLARRFTRTLVVSENERDAFCQMLDSDDERVSVVPNGVALDYFFPQGVLRDRATILLTGKMSYHANVTAALYLLDEIMPRVWQTFPEARVCLAGQNPPSELRERANERIEITGYVPDLRIYLSRATVACAPLLYGAGTQNKVLEAMACGTAVVATPQALAALNTQSEQDVLVGENAEQLSAQLTRVLGDSGLRTGLEQNGRRYVQVNHPWEKSARVLETIYTQALQDVAPAARN